MAGAWAECDRCSFRVRHAECRTEWSGAFVCSTCYDPRPAWLDTPIINAMEGAPVHNARLQRTPIYTDDDNPIASEDL